MKVKCAYSILKKCKNRTCPAFHFLDLDVRNRVRCFKTPQDCPFFQEEV